MDLQICDFLNKWKSEKILLVNASLFQENLNTLLLLLFILDYKLIHFLWVYEWLVQTECVCVSGVRMDRICNHTHSYTKTQAHVYIYLRMKYTLIEYPFANMYDVVWSDKNHAPCRMLSLST